MLGLVIGYRFQKQLHAVTVSLAIGPVSTRTGSRTPDEAGILDAMIQPLFDHRIVPVDAGGPGVALPGEKTVVPLLRLLPDKAQSGVGLLVFRALESTPPPFL